MTRKLFPVTIAAVLALSLGLVIAGPVGANNVECPCPDGTAPVYVETVNVPANSDIGVSSTNTLQNGTVYCFKVSGTWQDASRPTHFIDAEYTTFDSWSTHLDGTPNWGPNGKDLQVDDDFVSWGDYNTQHEYCLLYTGTGLQVHLGIFDGYTNLTPPQKVPSWYPDNLGSLTVEIYECVITNQHPDCTGAYADTDCIWPPNHKFVDITIMGVTDPDDDPVTIIIDSITIDEPTATDKGSGGAKHAPDAMGIGTDTASVRAERSGNGDGRVYVIHFTADDGLGGTCTGSVTFKVPHDQSDKTCPAVDSGQIYDATGIN